jgi:purine nucleosidase
VPGSRSAASDAIVAAAREDDELPLFVVSAGPLTNVAAALEQDPGIASRLTLVWVGGSIDGGAFEYNRDTDPAAAEFVFGVPGLEIHQFPLETYRRCAYGVAELEADLPATGRLGTWLLGAFSSPPDWVRLAGVWPLGDSPPLLVTALTTQSSTRSAVTASSSRGRPSPGDSVTVHLYTDIDHRLLVGDLFAKLRLHEQGRSRP